MARLAFFRFSNMPWQVGFPIAVPAMALVFARRVRCPDIVVLPLG